MALLVTFPASAEVEPAHINNLATEKHQPLPLKALAGSLQPVAEPTATGKFKPVDSGFERVFCGSPKQRTWKNSSAANIAIGQRLAAERGWTGTQFEALKELWSCESSWTTTVGNTEGSGAYGIPQSLPASKMASEGADYMTNPETQIRWGLGYIANRYGNPQAALNFHYAKNWY